MTTQTARLERVRTVDGVDIADTAVGTGRLAIIALHGWGGAGSGRWWRELVKHLDLTGLRFIAIDLRGHGASDRPETASIWRSSAATCSPSPITQAVGSSSWPPTA